MTPKKLVRISASMPLSASTNVPLCFKYLLQSSKFKLPLLTYKQRLVFNLEICDRKQAAALTKRVLRFDCSPPRPKRQPIMRQGCLVLVGDLGSRKMKGRRMREKGRGWWMEETDGEASIRDSTSCLSQSRSRTHSQPSYAHRRRLASSSFFPSPPPWKPCKVLRNRQGGWGEGEAARGEEVLRQAAGRVTHCRPTSADTSSPRCRNMTQCKAAHRSQTLVRASGFFCVIAISAKHVLSSWMEVCGAIKLMATDLDIGHAQWIRSVLMWYGTASTH